MQEGGPGLGKMLRRGAGQRPKRRERVLGGCRRAVGGAPPPLFSWRHRLPQMCPERRKSGTSSPFVGFCHPAAFSDLFPASCLPGSWGVLICSGPAVKEKIISSPSHRYCPPQ
ncbi:unnamed protein product [Rangifer tarandus platyrhynchus]|uniref:Uncharacterized protein n=2 Tax=Rangifer tarandus platyrhynchus TaxID=3082113 RepID=A0ABN8Z6P2_RANTA|nr:unnamed protein product [Rangifer tarandus platyrhynchus]